MDKINDTNSSKLDLNQNPSQTHDILSKRATPTKKIENVLTRYTIFLLIGAIIFGGSVFSYYQIEAIDEKILFDTKLNVKDSTEDRIKLFDQRISSIAAAYEGFYKGSVLVEQNEFEEFSSFILSENPIIHDVVILQHGEIVQWLKNPNSIGTTSILTDHSFVSQNNEYILLLFLFKSEALSGLEILLFVDASKLIDENSIFSTDYKLNIIHLDNADVIYSSQSFNAIKNYDAEFSESELENSVEIIFHSSLIPYGESENADFKVILWTSLFEDYDDFYQISIPISGFGLAITVSFLLMRSEKLRRENEEKTDSLLKSEKMAIIGELSARLAHDLRNPLSIIKNEVEILHLKKILPENDFYTLNRAIGRMNHQLNDVLQFLKSRPPELAKFSILSMFNSVIDMLHIPKNIAITLPENDAKITVDRHQFEVVLSNLLLNSIQAIDDKGTIAVRIHDSSNQVRIEIQDSGKGISEENIEKIFEPLFTTKQIGTGLGLASCKNIVEKHGGKIEVYTNPTVFSIILPKN